MIERKIELIKILWSGPYTPDQIRNNKKIGLYQIYGTHPIYGRNVLIYIGETTTSFIDRIKAHQNWMQYELDELVFYTGEIQSEEQNNIRYIKEAEKMIQAGKANVAKKATANYEEEINLSKKILEELNIGLDKKAQDLTPKELNDLKELIEKNYKIEGDLRRQIMINIKRLKESKKEID